MGRMLKVVGAASVWGNAMENDCQDELDDLFCKDQSAALTAVLRFHGVRALGWLRHKHSNLTRDEHDDILAEAISRTWRTYDPARGRIVPWFFRMVVNSATELHRYKKARPMIPLGSLEVEARDPKCQYDESEELNYYISKLPVRQRQVIQQDIESGGCVSNSELASRFGVSSSAISNLRSRAYNSLKLLLGRRNSA